MPRQSATQSPQRRLGDRRQRPRFEIVGQLWGSLELVEALTVVDLSGGGALLEGPAELPVESVHRVKVDTGTDTVDLQVRVAHARAVETANGTGLHRTGVEFVTLPDGAANWLESALASDSAPTRDMPPAAEGVESSPRD